MLNTLYTSIYNLLETNFLNQISNTFNLFSKLSIYNIK